MEPITTTLLISVATAAASAGAAVVGSQKATKATLNGMKERTERIETKLDKHIDDSATSRQALGERLARIEAKNG